MPIIELTNVHFSRTFSGSGVYYTNSDTSVYIVDSVLPGSTSGNKSLRITWNENVSIRWTVGNPIINFGSNIRIEIAVKYVNPNFLEVGKRAEAGIFIGNISAGVGVMRVSTDYQFYVFLKRNIGTLVNIQIIPNYFEQIVLRQQTNQILFHYSFSTPNTKNLINSSSVSTTLASGQAGFFLFTEDRTSGTVFFDYFFVEQFTSA